MLDFDQAKQRVFEALTEVAFVSTMNDTARKIAGLQKYSTVLRIETETFIHGDVVKPVVLLMALPDEFPLVLPKIYVSKDDKAWIGYIPHVDMAGFVCIYDEESIVADISRPDEIAKICLNKSLEIIEQGLKGVNPDDFADEFVAYWNEKYDDKDEIYSGLVMFEQIPFDAPCQVKFLTIEKSYSGYQIILYDQGKSIKRFRKFLNDKGYSTIEKEGLYLGSVKGLFPPFNFTNADTSKIVKDYFPQSQNKFEQYINQTTGYRLMIFSVISGSSHLFFGWYITQLNTNRNGFRNGYLTPFKVFDSFQKNDRVIRLQFDTYTKERLATRTDGIPQTAQHTITFAGLGSIGSNLLPNLMSLGIDNLHLIDPEVLSLVNINRHLLGPDDIGKPKVVGVQNYLLRNDPLVDIFTYQESVVKFIRSKEALLNQSDYLFIVVGKNTVENYILQSLQETKITIPIFFIWIEPYLAGAHCLYLQPGHALDYSTLYKDHLYKYNVIDKSEYQNPNNQISLREAGCQGSYIPYGQKNITLFLSSLLPYLFQIIDNRDTRNLSLTWKGETLKNISLKLSDYGEQLKTGNIQQNEL
jgi:hypothetical protein